MSLTLFGAVFDHFSETFDVFEHVFLFFEMGEHFVHIISAPLINEIEGDSHVSESSGSSDSVKVRVEIDGSFLKVNGQVGIDHQSHVSLIDSSAEQIRCHQNVELFLSKLVNHTGPFVWEHYSSYQHADFVIAVSQILHQLYCEIFAPAKYYALAIQDVLLENLIDIFKFLIFLHVRHKLIHSLESQLIADN